MSADARTILLSIENRVAVVTLNRPEKFNAFAGDMRERLVEALDAVAVSDANVLVITGAGRAFCAGGDVGFMQKLKEDGAPYDGLAPLIDAGRDIVTRLAALPVPVLAAVNGVAAGAGANLMLACDVRLASDEARFGESFVKIGLHADWGGTFALPRAVGLGKALDLCWTGDVIGADDMLRVGLVQRVWPAASFASEWQAYATKLAAAPQTSVRALKANLRASLHRTLEQCLDAETAAQEACWNSPDSTEGVRAFAEKRTAVFGAPAREFGAAPHPRSRRFE